MCLAIPARIIEIKEYSNTALVDYGGVEKEVNIEFVQVKKGDYILIHAGFAIQKIDESEAIKNLQALKELDKEIEKNI